MDYGDGFWGKGWGLDAWDGKPGRREILSRQDTQNQTTEREKRTSGLRASKEASGVRVSKESKKRLQCKGFGGGTLGGPMRRIGSARGYQ